MPTHLSAEKVHIAWRGDDLTGECPVWDDAGNALWWTDIEGRHLHRLDASSGAHVVFPTASRVGSFAPLLDDGFISATEHGFSWLDGRGKLDAITEPERDRADNRFNDGCCDRQGRFLAGSMSLTRRAASGSLWSLSPMLEARELHAGVTVANGLAFSPDGATMWWADSPQERVLQFDYEGENGALRNPRVWLDRGHAPGRPDGATVDADGAYWSARWQGGAVVRFSAAGKLDLVVELPAQQVTMCTFGGAGYKTLFVTTARNHLDAPALAEQPLAGSVFAIDVGVSGLPPTRFNAHFGGRPT